MQGRVLPGSKDPNLDTLYFIGWFFTTCGIENSGSQVNSMAKWVGKGWIKITFSFYSRFLET